MRLEKGSTIRVLYGFYSGYKKSRGGRIPELAHHVVFAPVVDPG